MAARSSEWKERVEVVAIDPSAPFRKAVTEQLTRAALSVDAFHLVKLANDALTAVRPRCAQQVKSRRGRLIGPSWANRRLLLRGADTLSSRGWVRLEATLRADDPTAEIGAAWGVKEQLRRLLRTGSLADAHTERMRLGVYVVAADTPETDKLWSTLNAWWPAIEVLIVTGATNGYSYVKPRRPVMSVPA